MDETCNAIRAATKGFGHGRKKRLIRALARHDPTVRYYTAVRYPSLHGGKNKQSLAALIDSECGERRDYALALGWLAMAPHRAEVAMIDLATDGLNTKENYLYPILCGRTNGEIQTLRTA